MPAPWLATPLVLMPDGGSMSMLEQLANNISRLHAKRHFFICKLLFFLKAMHRDDASCCAVVGYLSPKVNAYFKIKSEKTPTTAN